MKKLHSIIWLLTIGACFSSCYQDPKYTSIDPAIGYYVTYPSTVGTVGEGDTITVKMFVNASAAVKDGGSVTIDVITPTVEDPSSASYTLLDMDNNVLTSKALPAFSQSDTIAFKFVPVKNTIIDGNRIFKIPIVSNNMGIAVGKTMGAKMDTLTLNVIDNFSVDISELVGTWTVSNETISLSGAKVEDYTITIAQVSADTITVTDLMGIPKTLNGHFALNAAVKTITIPWQKVDGLSAEFDSYFTSSRRAYLGKNEELLINCSAVIAKSKTGQLSITWENVVDKGGTGYGYAATKIGTTTYMGYYNFCTVLTATWTKD